MSPIVLFCYKRSQYLEQTLISLAQNSLADRSTLYIYADGPENSTKERVAEVRRLIRQKRWQQAFAQLHIIEAATNQGLAPTVIRGVSEVLERHGRVIVLEDDVSVAPSFLEFMNEALELYQDEEQVGSIRAQVFDLPNTPELFFAWMSGDFAWGTWQRVWQKVELDGRKLLQELKRRKLTRHFDYDRHYPYTQLLRDQIAGRNSSWGVRFYASLFLQGMLTLYPGKALAIHNGYDEGTHYKGKGWSPLDGTLYPGRLAVRKIAVRESEPVRRQMKQLFQQEGFASFWLLRQILKKVLPSGLLRLLRQLWASHIARR